MATWIYGSMDIWIYGYMDLWIYDIGIFRTSPEEQGRVYRDKKLPPLVPCWHATDGFIPGGIKPGCASTDAKRPAIRKTYVFGQSFNTFLGILSARDDVAL